jgi:hypothetical protein
MAGDDGLLPGQFGFCHQRCTLSADQLGEFTLRQAAAMAGGDEAEGRKILEKYCGKPGTLSRTRFHGRGETMPLDYYRFLVEKRKLTGYVFLHFVAYVCKQYLTPFVKTKLQLRHELRGDPAGLSRSNAYKLLINGLYG